jgi:hypothetical protein
VQTTIVATVNNNGAERRDIVVEIKDQNNNTLCQSNPVTVPAGAAGTTVNIPYTFNQPAGTSLTLKSKIGALESPPSAAYTVR